MTVALDFLRLGFLSCAVFVSLITIVVLHGKCCNKRRRLAAASEIKDSEENTAVQNPSACVDSDTSCPCATVHAITGQPQLPSPVECHRKPILFEPSFSPEMTSESSSKRRQPKNSPNRIGSPLKSIDEGMKQTILSQNTSKLKSPAASRLPKIEEHEPMTGDGKSDSNRDEGDGGCGGEPGVPRAATDSRQRKDPRQPTPSSTRSSVATNRDSFLSSNTYNSINTNNTINTVNSYETMPSTDSGFPSRNSQKSQYDWVIIRSADRESHSHEQTSSHRPRRSSAWEEEEEEEEGQREGEGVFDPQYDSLYPHYCGTLLPSDGTYEALKKPDYPATISTAHPVTQSQQIELQNMIKAEANLKRSTVSLG